MEITFNHIYKNYYNEILKIVSDNIEGNEIETALTDVFLQIDKSLSRYDSRKSNNIMNFLSIVAKFKTLDYNRRMSAKKRQFNYITFNDYQNIDNHYVEQYNYGVEDIDNTLKETLSNRDYSRYLELINSNDNLEFAKKLNITPNRAKTIIFRLRKKIKNNLELV